MLAILYFFLLFSYSRMPRHSCCEVRVMQVHDTLLLRTSDIPSIIRFTPISTFSLEVARFIRMNPSNLSPPNQSQKSTARRHFFCINSFVSSGFMYALKSIHTRYVASNGVTTTCGRFYLKSSLRY